MSISVVPYEMTNNRFPYSDIDDAQIDLLAGLIRNPDTVDFMHQTSESANHFYATIHPILTNVIKIQVDDPSAQHACETGLRYFESLGGMLNPHLDYKDVDFSSIISMIYGNGAKPVGILKAAEDSREKMAPNMPLLFEVIASAAAKNLDPQYAIYALNLSALLGDLQRDAVSLPTWSDAYRKNPK